MPDTESGSTPTAELAVDRKELADALRILTRNVKVTKAGEAIIQFVEGNLVIRIGGAKVSARASGRWPGEARLPGAFILATAKFPVSTGQRNARGERRASDEMNDLDVAPARLEVLGYEAAVAVVRLVFTAQETALGKDVPGNRLLDLTGTHQFEKLAFVDRPVSLVLPVAVEHVLRRRKGWLVYVIHVADLTKEILEVVPLRESCQL